MKKILILLIALIPTLLNAQITPPIYPQRGPSRVVYNGDTVDIYFSGDTAKFKTDKGVFVFNKPIKIHKDTVAMKSQINALLAMILLKEPIITPSSELYYFNGNKQWALMPGGQNVFPWALEATKPVYTATEVGLANVNNTADTLKPVSQAQLAALNLKANINSPTFTGTVGGVTKAMVGLPLVDNTADVSKPVSGAQQTALDLKEGTISLSTALTYYRGDKTWQTLNKASVGLLNVDNTSDINKPVSIIMQD